MYISICMYIRVYIYIYIYQYTSRKPSWPKKSPLPLCSVGLLSGYCGLFNNSLQGDRHGKHTIYIYTYIYIRTYKYVYIYVICVYVHLHLPGGN